jgi:hypothetical protein
LNLKVIGGAIPPVGFAAGEVKAQLIITWDTDEPARHKLSLDKDLVQTTPEITI